MTVFNSGNQTDNNDGVTTTSFVDQLVSAKGDNWRDPEVIAKGKLEADKVLQERDSRIGELEAALSKQDYAKDILEQIQSKASSNGGETLNGKSSTDGGEGNTTLNQDDLESLVNKTIDARSAKQQSDSNLSQTNAKLEEMFGTEASNVVNKKASEVGMTVDALQSLASNSPQAFFKLIGEGNVAQDNKNIPSSVNTATGFNNSKERDWNYYRALKKENPKLYRSAEIQNQIIEDRIRLGNNFGLT